LSSCLETIIILKYKAEENSKIRKIYEKKISEITLTQNHCCYAIDTADFDNEYIYSIQNGYFNQIHDEWSYIKSYGIQDNIKVLSDIENITPKSVLLLSIPISCIQYFTKDGDVQYTTKVSGGGGGGSSISGAVIGGLVAGSTGAIIGSRGKIGSIYSTTEKHDTSKTILVFKNGSALETIVFKGHDMYNFLFNEIPEKDLLYVQLKGQPETSNQDNNIKEHLKTLKELFEDGLIKEEEYNEKKSELLKRL